MELLEKLTQCYGPSGYEGRVREMIISEVSPYADEVTTDAMGNITAHKKGAGKRIMLAAHMDEIGVIVSSIDKNGFLRFAALGGLYVKDLTARRVVFKNGTRGVIQSEEEDFAKKPELKKLYIDIGAKNEEEAKKYVNIGDAAVFEGGFFETENTVVSKALDNRAGCYVMIKTLQNLSESRNDLYFVFTVQEEVGLRGAKTAAFSVAPDYAVALDVTDTGDTPSAPAMDIKAGGGAAIKVMDRSVICSGEVRSMLTRCARGNGIPYQMEIMTDGGTDAGAIHLTRAGVKTGGISIPTRYIHSPSELAYKSDIDACVKLLSAAVNEDWI